MARRSNFKMSITERQYRRFSSSFRQQKVRELEKGTVSVSDICKEYEVAPITVYRWLKKFGTMKKRERTIVETESDTKKLLEAQQKIAELERLLGQKQIQLEFKDKMIEIAEDMYNVDIKKKLTGKLSGTSGTSGKKTGSV